MQQGQFPFFWYSVPALIKEWFDLVLEYGFAYGTGGDKLKDMPFLTAITAAGPDEAYRKGGYNNFPMRVLTTPLEQTANLCGMRFIAPYVLNAALRAEAAGETGPHVAGYARLVDLIVTDRLDWDAARKADLLRHDNLPALKEH